MLRTACLFLGASFLAAASARAAAPPTHPVVPGFERFHTGARADAAGGRLLLGELNCVSCHTTDDKSLTRKQAPVLDHVAGRVRTSYLKKFLRDPQAVKPGTTMPNLLSGDPDAAAKVEALVHFLATTGSLQHARPDLKSIAPGRDLYHRVGCVACHGTRDAAGHAATLLPASVPLGDLPAKYSLASLATFLEHPHQTRPSGRMPRLLNAQEAKSVANYLLQGLKVDLTAGKGGTHYRYYEGTWDRLPDFAKLKPVAKGTGAGFDLGVARRHHNYALKFDGVLKVDRDGLYTFTLTSDDGSRLAVDGKSVVNNDGTHPPATQRGRVRLTKGVHKVTVTFFQGGGGDELNVEVESPGFGHHNLGDLVAVSEAALEKRPPAVRKDDDTIDIQPTLAAKGKALFTSLGCASCHQLREGGKPLASSRNAPALARLKTTGGCLSTAAVKGVPWYGLDADQRKALTASLTDKAPPRRTPAAVVARTMTTFNCYACHVRAKVGGPEAGVNKFFQTAQPEMGEEGRLPPPLDGVGAKLNPDYFKQLLDGGSHERPYMYTRMPGFGAGNVGHLVEEFAALDKLPVVPPVKFKQSLARVKTAARHLVGGQALGCIKCHTFAGHKAEGVQGIDMATMPRRLRRDWFHAYVPDPAKLRPGTRMPSSFTDGKSVLPNVLDGTTLTQVEAIWVYLKDGSRARLPVGMQKHSIPLVPDKNAIIYRNFIEGSGPRAIGVGYPEKTNLSFDANEMRLALIWRGAFIDAARHWTDRGAGFEGPLGDDVLHLHPGAPFAVLAKADEAWPAKAGKALGYRFRGYRLTKDDRPTFLYSVNGIKVEDFPNPIPGKEGSLRRTFDLTADKAADNLVYRAAVGNKIEALKDGWYQVDGAWKLRVQGGGKPRVRKSGGKVELLVPVVFKDGKARLIQDYDW